METFGKYTLLERLAAGGMAEVYLAKSMGAGGIAKFMAVKRILPQYSDNIEFIDMFKEEAKIAVNLNHNNVVSIFDFGMEHKQFFLVMEYVDGQNLRQVLNHLKKSGKYFSIDQIVYIIKEIAAGLDHAHRCLDGTTGRPLNITHRDMSPQNVMLSFEGEVKIVDFGIAKAESQIENTKAGTIKGKFGYMSPEQADGQNVDLRTDIFSLGIVLWELLANDRLFTASNEAATLKKIRECQIPPLRKLNPAIPPELERISNKALAKDRSLRYQTSASFHRDLNRFLNTQYPEFSPHDFSIFMKSAFSQMFIDNRKRLIEYAKINVIPDGKNQPQTKVTATATQTDTNNKNNNSNKSVLGLEVQGFHPDEDLNVDLTMSRKVDLKDLQLDVPIKKIPKFESNQQTGVHKTYNATQSGIRNPRFIQNSNNSFLSYFLVIIILLGSGYFYMSNSTSQNFGAKIKNTLGLQHSSPTVAETKTTTPEQSQLVQQTDVASKQPVVISITSQPQGARIYIDGQDTGMITPARKAIDSGKEFTVSLRLAGYQLYQKKDTAESNGYQVSATLLPLPKMGYLDIDLTNGGSNPVVMINGQRVEDKFPLKNYAVTAGQSIRIQAHNPFTGLSTEQVITVEANQRRQINLILSQKARH